jgi:hypothetical protein
MREVYLYVSYGERLAPSMLYDFSFPRFLKIDSVMGKLYSEHGTEVPADTTVMKLCVFLTCFGHRPKRRPYHRTILKPQFLIVSDGMQ